MNTSFTVREIQIILAALENLPVSSTLKELRDGTLKVNPEVEEIIIKLNSMQEVEANEVSGTDAVETETVATEAPVEAPAESQEAPAEAAE